MRYAPPGLCVNDFALLRDDDGSYAVLHLQGPWTAEFDPTAIYLSDDGWTWRRVAPPR